jgi:hypothetical protein
MARRLFDAVHAEAPLGQRQRNASGADGELQHGGPAALSGEEVDGLGLIAAQVIVVARRDLWAEACERVESLHVSLTSSRCRA